MDFGQFTQQVMNSLSKEEQLAFLQLRDGHPSHRKLVNNGLIKTNRNVAKWLAYYDGRLLEYVGQFCDDPEIVRIAMEDRDQSICSAGTKLFADREFLTAIMQEYPTAAYEAFKNASARLQLDPDVAQIYLQSNLAAMADADLRANENSRRSAGNYYQPEAEALLDLLLTRYEYYTEIYGTNSKQAFDMMRAERMPALQNELIGIDLPPLE